VDTIVLAPPGDFKVARPAAYSDQTSCIQYVWRIEALFEPVVDRLEHLAQNRVLTLLVNQPAKACSATQLY
jgi:hypothetical protein